MAGTVRVVHYLNQFFAGRGGEEAASAPPEWHDGPKGPGQLVAQLAPGAEVVGTLSAGDNHVAEHLDTAIPELVALLGERLAGREVDVLVAGPAFNAGRYGLACAALCEAVEATLGIPAVTALYPESPAVDTHRPSPI